MKPRRSHGAVNQQFLLPRLEALRQLRLLLVRPLRLLLLE